MADWTTVAAHVTRLQNAIANRDPAVAGYRTPDGRQVTYRTLEEIRNELQYWEGRAAAEASLTGSASRRTQAKPYSGGSW